MNVRFSIRVTIERKLFINTSTIVAILGKLMAKSRQPTASFSPSVRAFANRCSLTFVGSTLLMILRSYYSIVLKGGGSLVKVLKTVAIILAVSD